MARARETRLSCLCAQILRASREGTLGPEPHCNRTQLHLGCSAGEGGSWGRGTVLRGPKPRAVFTWGAHQGRLGNIWSWDTGILAPWGQGPAAL